VLQAICNKTPKLHSMPAFPLSDHRNAYLQAAGDFSSAVILPVDVEDVGDAYNFIADVPGLEKGDIKVTLPTQLCF